MIIPSGKAQPLKEAQEKDIRSNEEKKKDELRRKERRI